MLERPNGMRFVGEFWGQSDFDRRDDDGGASVCDAEQSTHDVWKCQREKLNPQTSHQLQRLGRLRGIRE